MPDHLTTEKGIIAALADTSTSHPRRKARYLDGVDGPNRWKSPCKESTSLKSCPFPLLRLPWGHQNWSWNMASDSREGIKHAC